MKLAIADVRVTYRTIEVPDVCPNCAQPFIGTDTYPIKEYDLVDARGIGIRVNANPAKKDGTEVEIDETGSDSDAEESYHPVGYYCAECRQPFAEGKITTDEPSSAPYITGALAPDAT